MTNKVWEGMKQLHKEHNEPLYGYPRYGDWNCGLLWSLVNFSKEFLLPSRRKYYVENNFPFWQKLEYVYYTDLAIFVHKPWYIVTCEVENFKTLVRKLRGEKKEEVKKTGLLSMKENWKALNQLEKETGELCLFHCNYGEWNCGLIWSVVTFLRMLLNKNSRKLFAEEGFSFWEMVQCLYQSHLRIFVKEPQSIITYEVENFKTLVRKLRGQY